MGSFEKKTAIVTGGTSGVGRETVRLLLAEGAKVATIARRQEGLDVLRRESSGDLHTFAGDASDPAVGPKLVRELAPDLIVLCAGAHPKLALVHEHTWESFSEPWNSDVKSAFHFVRAALELPLRPGSTVAIVSSGAAIGGSPLSGGYAGAKRMQWFLAGYAQQASDAKKLGIRFVAVVPKQLIAGTETAAMAGAAYAAKAGVSPEDFMKRFGEPLYPAGVAAAIAAVLRGDIDATATAIGVTGKGTEKLG